MAKTPPPKAPAKKSGIVGFLESPGPMGLPWFVWGIVIIGAGIAGFLWARNQNKPTADAGTTSSNPADANALGLAIDPTTGLPYAVEGLVPSGGLGGTGDPYAQEINQLQQELDELMKSQPTAKPVPQGAPPVKPTPAPTGGGSISYPGGMTIPKGGLKYTVPKNEELEHIAAAAYGPRMEGAYTYIITANPTLKGDTGESPIKKGKVLLLPQVPVQAEKQTG